MPHNCPAQGAQQGAQAGQPAAPVGPVQQAAPVQQQGAGAPSVTQLLLQVSQEHLAVSKELLAISKEQLSLLKALHPEFGNVPTQEQQSSPEDAPPEYERADTIEEPPK